MTVAVFPTTGLLDNFNRADGTLGANWTSPVGNTYNAMQVNGNRALIAGATPNFADAQWNTDFGPDMEAYLTIGAVGLDIKHFWLYARATDTGVNADWYEALYREETAEYTILRANNGSQQVIGQNIGGPVLAAGDKFGLEVWGSTPTYLRVWVFQGGVWTEVGTTIDQTSPITNAGKAGFGMESGGSVVDDFSGGTMIGDPDTRPTAKTVTKKHS